MNDEVEGLRGRIDGLRLILSIIVASLPNRFEVIYKLQQAEALARQRNLPTGTLEEMAALREALDDL